MSLWNDLVIRLSNAKDNIATAIANKGTTVPENSGFESFANLIDGISTGADTSGVTAVAADVLAGKNFVNASGNLVAGTMANNGAVSKTLTVSSLSYTVPAGYHNGSGKVSTSKVQFYATGTVTNSLAEATKTINTGVTLKASDIFILMPDASITDERPISSGSWIACAMRSSASNFRIGILTSSGLGWYMYDTMSIAYSGKNVTVEGGSFYFRGGVVYRWVLLR